MQEMVESIQIVHQAIENLPAGPVNVDVDSKVVPPDQTSVYRSIESMIQHFELVMPNRQMVAAGRRNLCAHSETANRELGFYVVSTARVSRSARARTLLAAVVHPFRGVPSFFDRRPPAKRRKCRRAWQP